MIIKCPRCGTISEVPQDAKMCLTCGGTYNWYSIWIDRKQRVRYGEHRLAYLPRYERGKDGKLRVAKFQRVCRKWRERNKKG